MLLAWVLGNALQLQQAQLGTGLDYLWPLLVCSLFALGVHMAWRHQALAQTQRPYAFGFWRPAVVAAVAGQRMGRTNVARSARAFIATVLGGVAQRGSALVGGCCWLGGRRHVGLALAWLVSLGRPAIAFALFVLAGFSPAH